MSRDVEWLLDILEASKRAVMFVTGKTEEEFHEDIECQYAVTRTIEIIGEAARRISDHTRNLHPELPWRDMISMRNRLIHEYDDVDLALVWETVSDDLPHLISLIEPLVPPEQQG
jgi:uncharacterized protein with HEPN domain